MLLWLNQIGPNPGIWFFTIAGYLSVLEHDKFERTLPFDLWRADEYPYHAEKATRLTGLKGFNRATGSNRPKLSAA